MPTLRRPRERACFAFAVASLLPGAACRDRGEDDRVAVPGGPGDRARRRLRRRLGADRGGSRRGGGGRRGRPAASGGAVTRGEVATSCPDATDARAGVASRDDSGGRRACGDEQEQQGRQDPVPGVAARSAVPRCGRLRSGGAAARARAPHSRQYSWPGSARGSAGRSRPQAESARPASSAGSSASASLSSALGGGPAVRAEERVGRQRMVALGAGHARAARPRAGRSSGRSASPRAAARRTRSVRPASACARCREHLVELVQPRVEAEQLVAALGEQVLAGSDRGRYISSIRPPRSRNRSSRVRWTARRSRRITPGGGSARRGAEDARIGGSGRTGPRPAESTGLRAADLRTPAEADEEQHDQEHSHRADHETGPRVQEEQGDPDHDEGECGSDHGGRRCPVQPGRKRGVE